MTDISASYWAAEFIEDLVARGIINGYPNDDGTFRFEPENDITRAEMIKLIVVSLGLDLVYEFDGSDFADWDEVEDWAKPYVAAAVEAGIVEGANEGDGIYILGNSNVTREEMIAMSVRALEVDIDEEAEVDTDDADDVSDWAAASVAFAVDYGMINIDGDDNVNPGDNAKRSEAAMILFMLIEYLES